MESTSTESGPASSKKKPPAKTGKRSKAPPPKPKEGKKNPATSFQIEMVASAEVRKIEILKTTKDDQERDIVELKVTMEATGEQALQGLPYSSAFKELLACSQETTEGHDVSTLKVKRTYRYVDVLFGDGVRKTRVKLINAKVHSDPVAKIVKGEPTVKIGVTGLMPCADLVNFAHMRGRTIDLEIEPVQQELNLDG